MNDGSQEALQDIQERPRKSESHGPSAELDYWLTRAEETFRREPTLSQDLRRAVWVEMKAVWCYSSAFFRHIFGTMQFLVGAYIAFALTHERLVSILPESLGGRALVSSAGAVVLAWAWWGCNAWATSWCAHRAVIARERLHRWLWLPETARTSMAGRWDRPSAPSPATGFRQHAGELANADEPCGQPAAPRR